MDINALKTFLEVAKTRHFGQAAENLFVSQSTVSARIRTLEETLGVDLFIRERGNIHLSAAGEALITHAKSMMTLWARAQHEISASHSQASTLSVGGLSGLWDISVQNWLHAVSQTYQDLLLKADVYSPKSLVQHVVHGGIDIAFLYDAPQGFNLGSQALSTIELRMVSSKRVRKLPADWAQRYIKVDWGMNFAVQFAAEFPEITNPKLETGLGRIALEHLRRAEGFAYLAQPAVQTLVDSEQLFFVPKTPVFKRQAYAIYNLENEKIELVESVLRLL